MANKYCDNCHDCENCQSCNDCENCYNCISCTGCKDCVDCKGGNMVVLANYCLLDYCPCQIWPRGARAQANKEYRPSAVLSWCNQELGRENTEKIVKECVGKSSKKECLYYEYINRMSKS